MQQSFIQRQESIPHFRTSSITYRLTAGLNTLESRGDGRGGDTQEEEDNIRREAEKGEVTFYRKTFGRKREERAL